MSFKEIVHDYEEFKNKVNRGQPIHHSCVGEWVDKYGILYRMTFRIYGVSRQGNIIIFEIVRDIDTMSKEFFEKYHNQRRIGFQEIYNQMAEKYAKPLGSTEGMLEP